MGKPFYITTAISYPNGKPHIGHAYEAIAADAIARFQRARALDAYARARETAAIAPRLSLDPAATVFQLGTILASVAPEAPSR